MENKAAVKLKFLFKKNNVNNVPYPFFFSKYTF